MPWWRPSFLPRFAKNSFYWLVDFSRLQAEERRDYFRRKTRALKKRVWPGSRHGNANGHSVDLDELINVSLFSEEELKLWQIHLRADHDTCRSPTPGESPFFTRWDNLCFAHWILSAAGANWPRAGWPFN